MILSPLVIVVLAASAFYIAVLGIFAWGVSRLKTRGEHDRTAPDREWPSVTVAVPLRNEEKNVQALLDALSAQDYAGEWSVIFVDDRSTDRTQDLLRSAVEGTERFRLLAIDAGEPPVASPKKRALERAFLMAKSEILMTLDADCTPPRCWIRSMISNFTDGVDIVQGPKRVRRIPGILHGIQALETLGFTLIEAAFFSLGTPMLASAPSLAYRRSVYEAAGGLAALGDLVSGDDDMLVQRMRHYARGVTYNADPEAQVETVPASDWPSFFSQRARWASNGTRYESKRYVLLLLAIYLFFVMLALSPAIAWFSGSCWPLLLIGAKGIGDLLLLGIGATKLRSLSLLWLYPFTYAIQVVVILWSPLAGAMGWYNWKGSRGNRSSVTPKSV